MKKIFDDNEKFDRVLYSEQYVVVYNVEGPNYIWVRQSNIYYAAGKNAHKAVMSRFKKDAKKNGWNCNTVRVYCS